eukprot:jgi/Tetstr1/463855/TSEL_008668.t1
MPEPSGDDGSATLAPAAGAIAVPRRLANGVRQTLQRAQWLKRGRNVAPLEGGDQLAVVLNGGGAAAVRAALAGGCSGGGLPGELGALLAEGGGGRFLDGFRRARRCTSETRRRWNQPTAQWRKQDKWRHPFQA